MSSESANEDCIGWAARDPSGLLSPYKFSRRCCYCALDFHRTLDFVIGALMMIMGGRSLLLHVLVMLLLFMKPAIGFNSGVRGEANSRCIEKEREALLKFKQGLVDDYEHLNYLDLSYNDFKGSTIPKFIGHLTKLRYLGLSGASFVGSIPSQLGNLTNLQYLDLGQNGDFLYAEKLEWLSHLSSLRHLDMTDVNLSKASDWLQTINMLPSLSDLLFHGCQLSAVVVPPSLSFANSSASLAILNLPYNHLSSSIFRWLFNFSASLVHVDLSYNPLQGLIPDEFQNMKSLSHLLLSSNQLEGRIPNPLGISVLYKH
ncbi:hypothetical protein L1049_016401 [Liquidambar formosana]|uniref:Uncharacterized protein n=1 Tax=Liquidambar formosana TaxID=63359 RepID=A0AAP0S544_LIQFO